MITIKKRLATIIFLAFLSTATLVSCGGKQAAETEEAEEHPEGEEHPEAADSTEHPAGEEHPADSTQQQ